MKGVLIVPFYGCVEVEHAGGLEAVCMLLAAHRIDCVRLLDAAVYVDDEGLFGEPAEFFKICDADGEWSEWIAGRGLVVGTGRGGTDADSPLSAEQVRARVRYGRRVP